MNIQICSQISQANLASNLCPAGNPGRAGWADIAGQIGLADLAANFDFHSGEYRDLISCDIEKSELV